MDDDRIEMQCILEHETCELLGKIIDNFKQEVRLHYEESEISQDLIRGLLEDNKYNLYDRYVPLIGLAAGIVNPSPSDVSEINNLLLDSFDAESLCSRFNMIVSGKSSEKYNEMAILNTIDKNDLNDICLASAEFIDREQCDFLEIDGFKYESMFTNNEMCTIHSLNGESVEVRIVHTCGPVAIIDYEFSHSVNNQVGKMKGIKYCFSGLYHKEKGVVYSRNDFDSIIHFSTAYEAIFNLDVIYENIPEEATLVMDYFKEKTLYYFSKLIIKHNFTLNEIFFLITVLLHDDLMVMEKIDILQFIIEEEEE